MILTGDFRGELCEEKGENKNSRAVNRPEAGVSFWLNGYCLAHQKIVIFCGQIDPWVIFQMHFESLHSELCGKSYRRFAKTAQDIPELCTVVFELNFRGCVMVIRFCTMNESVTTLPKICILRIYSLIGGWGERYGLSKVELQTIIWGKKEIVIFGNIIRGFDIIMDVPKKLPSLVSSTTLIVYRSLLGLENWVKWRKNEIWEVESNDSRSVHVRPK